MRVVGIDPGTATIGFSVVEGSKQNPIILEFGVLKTLPRPKEENHQRLLEIADDVEHLLQKYTPELAVVEDLFFYNNQKTAISVAQSRGVILYLLAKYNVKLLEFTPLQVKQFVSGYGKASKAQVQKTVQKIFNLAELPKPDDAADSLAMAWLGLN